MKIAVPSDNGVVNQHFGRSQSFAVIEVDNNNRIGGVSEVSSTGLQHRHEELAGLLKEQGVEVVIVGGIGDGAMQSLESQGLKVLFGAAGPVRDVAESFARGEFVSRKTVCNHHDGHGHSHNH